MAGIITAIDSKEKPSAAYFDTTIDEIPLELSSRILDLLSPTELFRLSLVSKKLSVLTAQYRNTPHAVNLRWPEYWKEPLKAQLDWGKIFVRRALADRNTRHGIFNITTMQGAGLSAANGLHRLMPYNKLILRRVGIAGIKPFACGDQFSILNLTDGKISQALEVKGNVWLCGNKIWKVVEEHLHAWDLTTGELIFQLEGWQGEICYIDNFTRFIVITTHIRDDGYYLYIINPLSCKLISLMPPEGVKSFLAMAEFNDAGISVLWQDNSLNAKKTVVASYIFHFEHDQEELNPASFADVTFLMPREIKLDKKHHFIEFEGLYLSCLNGLKIQIYSKSAKVEILTSLNIAYHLFSPGRVFLLCSEVDHRGCLYSLQELNTTTLCIERKLPLFFWTVGNVSIGIKHLQDKILLLYINPSSACGEYLVINTVSWCVDKRIPFKLDGGRPDDSPTLDLDDEKFIIHWSENYYVFDFAILNQEKPKFLTVQPADNFKIGRQFLKGKSITFESYEWPSTLRATVTSVCRTALESKITTASLIAALAYLLLREK